MKVQNKRIFASILFVLISFVCFAGDPPEPPPPGPPGPGFPIDGGVIIGVFVAMYFGSKKILDKNN